MSALFSYLKSSGSWFINGWYSRHYMLYFPLIYPTIPWWKFPVIYVSIISYGWLIMYINNRWWRINIQHSMLAHLVFHNISIVTYKWLRGGINNQYSMLYFHCFGAWGVYVNTADIICQLFQCSIQKQHNKTILHLS